MFYKFRIVQVLLFCFTLSLINVQAQNKRSSCRNHFIILVDQTSDSRCPILGDAISEVFRTGEYSQSEVSHSGNLNVMSFDPQQDDLTLFAFAMPGVNNGTFCNIRSGLHNGTIQPQQSYTAIRDGLVYPRKNYKSDGTSLSVFCNNELTSLFNGNDFLPSILSAANPGVTYSHFARYMCIDKLDAVIPAEKYYLITVSNFNAGLLDAGDSRDLTAIHSDLFGSDQSKYSVFDRAYDAVKYGYNLKNVCQLNATSTDGHSNVIAMVQEVSVNASDATQAYVSMIMSVRQQEYNGTVYDHTSSAVSFPHDNSMEIDCIERSIVLCDNGGVYKPLDFATLANTKEEAEALYDDVAKQYQIPAFAADFGQEIESGQLLYRYAFYGNTLDQNGNILLPYVIKAETAVPSDAISVAPAPIGTNVWVIFVLGLFILGFIAWYIIRRWKSIHRNLVLQDLRVVPISNTRYMDVRDNKVVDYDCWYIREGDKSTPIQVNGCFRLETISKWMLDNNYKLKVEYAVYDEDQDDEFSFRPQGFELDGSKRQCSDSYHEHFFPATIDENGFFSFVVDSFVEDGCSPVYDNGHHILRLGIRLRTSIVDKNGVIVRILDNKYKDQYLHYSYIVRPWFRDNALWVSIDPGTSGSCISFGCGGHPISKDNIYLATEKISSIMGQFSASSTEDKENCIYPSKIQILPNTNLEDVTQLRERKNTEAGQGEYFFGFLAQMFEIQGAANVFQSIKKLLGYNDYLPVRLAAGKTEYVSGKDLAYLLVKSLCSHFEDYVRRDDLPNPIPSFIKTKLIDENDNFHAQRAIVAVPNSYTIGKIEAMVNSVRRTEVFKEVHFIYESEAVMMTYLRDEWNNLSTKTGKTYIVFDMGGATINATAFAINNLRQNEKGIVDTMELETKSKVGYTVGGDNIDYAIIEIILEIPSFKAAYESRGEDKESMKRKFRQKLLVLAREIKLHYIRKEQGDLENNLTKDTETFWSRIDSWFNENCKITAEKTEDDERFILEQHNTHVLMEQHVLRYVEEAIDDLMANLGSDCDVELILSGRSTLYPGIRARIQKAFSKHGAKCNVWTGFNKPGTEFLDDLKVKTAVSVGACWYAMFSKYVLLSHDILTATFGFVDMNANGEFFNPILRRDAHFDSFGKVSAEVTPQFSNMNSVDVYQMNGSKFEQVLKPEYRYKYSRLMATTADQITGQIHSIKMTIDQSQNLEYEINIVGRDPIKVQYIAPDVEITSENNEAYTFAALTTTEDDVQEIPIPGDASKIGHPKVTGLSKWPKKRI